MEMWIFVAVLVISLTMLVAYVVVRDKHHPFQRPVKGYDQDWGNYWMG